MLLVDLGRTLSPRTVSDVLMLLKMLMAEAVADRRITFNPAHGVKVTLPRRPERPHATVEQVNTIASRMARRGDQILVITAAYTGMRWGELTGLHRDNINLHAGEIHIDAEEGALHEVAGKLFLGPPKTPDSARPVRIPAFLADLLGEQIDSHRHPAVFCGAHGGYQRRSNFNRRAWTPAVAGNPARGVPPVLAGMHFHDLRHTHKTWLIEDGIPEIAQARRLGHRLSGVRGVYSHVTEPMQQAIIEALQQRWQRSTIRAAADEQEPKAA